jgi:SWI/SNF-related matrix-associated actin-dependent regulator of chromatin subfamily A-like protein 1
MAEQLEPYQIEGSMFLAGRSRASIFDEPGLGKTAQAIRAREMCGDTSPALVICPAGVRQVWPYQFSLWGRTGAKVIKADSIFDLSTWLRGKIDVLVISYEQAVMWQKDLRSDFFGPLIIDESHYLKNPDAKRTRAICGDGTGAGGIANFASHVWCLTGTPIKNDPADLWIPLRMARATDLSFTKFQKKYFKQAASTFSVTNTIRKEMLAEIKTLIASMSLMRTFEDVGAQLPPIRLDILPVDGTQEAIVNYLRQYPGLSERIVASVEAEQSLSFDDGTHISTLRALIAEAKAPGYAKLITEELKSGTIDKLVVMANHRKAIELVTAHLQNAGIRAEKIVGGTSENDRTAIVRSFQDDPNGVRVIVGNIQAAGTGLTLTAACRLDMLESSWTPADNVQAIRRVRRKGQTRPTLARFVMLNDSFDQRVAKVVVRKANTTVVITAKDNMQEAMAR